MRRILASLSPEEQDMLSWIIAEGAEDEEEGQSPKHPDVPIEGYDPENTGIPGTGETLADMFLDALKERDPKLADNFKNGEGKLIIKNS
ncbi:MAG: hypothetical protein JWN50_626 [Parcubacteria group bacterium]|nr:hypothetical protein [Parcubacteria group bacterium]